MFNYGLQGFAPQTYKSSSGQILPTSGTIRILIVFAEIIGGSQTYVWQAGSLPPWKDDLLDPTILGVPHGTLTKYFYEASFGSYHVLGDYLINPTNPGAPFQVTSTSALKATINASGPFQTNSGFSITDFDLWTKTAPGLLKITPSNDSPNKYDHIMIIWRNDPNTGPGSGNAHSYSFGLIHGYESDSYTVNGADALPTAITRHEFSHLIYGGNNFHCGGGGYNDPPYYDYFVQHLGGWSNMGLAGSSLQCWNAWDRQRMNWKPTTNQYNPSARNPLTGNELNGDLDATVTIQQGNYLLRDFVTTGDAIRIKLPYLSNNNLFNQWLWIENHQTTQNNNCEFDQFKFQGSGCTTDAIPGLYAYIQIDKEERENSNTSAGIYSGYPDFLKPLTADGNWDLTFEPSIPNICINTASYPPYKKTLSNPLTGSCDQEAISYDKNPPFNLIYHDEHYNHAIENLNGNNVFDLPENGHERHAFTTLGLPQYNNPKIGMGTNPSSANAMNLVSGDPSNPNIPQNVRSIYLNGVSVEIVNQFPNGDIEVNVRFDDVDVKNDARWCADEIILNPIPTPSLLSLNLKSGNTITIERGTTATRNINPENYNGQNVFNSATVFRALDGSWINMESNSTIIVDNGSTLKLENGSRLDIGNDATLIIRNGSHLKLEGGSLINVADRGRIIIEEGNGSTTTDADMEFFPNARINLNAFYAQLEIAGNLFIKDNATFTVLSAASNTLTMGSVKFSSTDAVSQNVFVENNCSFVLRSNLQVRKMLYVVQETLYAP